MACAAGSLAFAASSCAWPAASFFFAASSLAWPAVSLALARSILAWPPVTWERALASFTRPAATCAAWPSRSVCAVKGSRTLSTPPTFEACAMRSVMAACWASLIGEPSLVWKTIVPLPWAALGKAASSRSVTFAVGVPGIEI